MSVSPLRRVSAVDALVAALRRDILDGLRPGGARLREHELCGAYGVARHTLRAALRALAAEGLVRIEPNRGASVAQLSAQDVRWLYELRAALELEAAHLALERHGGRLPPAVHDAQAALERACADPEPAWSAVADTHLELHSALVAASGSPRIAAAHTALAGELRLFLLQLRPHATARGLAEQHAELLAALEREGTAPLRSHLRASADTLAAP